MGKKRENREFAGELPKNWAIAERVRKEGYYSVLFNKTDFMDAVLWAANLYYEYRDFYRLHKDRIVISEVETQSRKEDLVNAHFLLVIYYKMKENLVLMEEIKQSLLSVAKLQKIPLEDIEIMKRWDAYLLQVRQKQESGDLSVQDIGSLQGTEVKYERYTGIVAKEAAKFQADLAKL